MNTKNATRRLVRALLIAFVALALPDVLARANDVSESGKRKAAIAAILQAGGEIRVVTSATAEMLERLPINSVDLSEATVSNELLLHVANLQEVTRLNLSFAEIDDIGLRTIAHLPLRELWLQSTNITDASAATISKMETLSFLQLNSLSLSDQFLAELKGLPNLKILGLRGTLVTGDGMKHLSRHPKLSELDVYKTEVDDTGVDALTACQMLRFIGLSNTRITNDVLQKLSNVPRLSRVDLSGNRVLRQESIATFRKNHPTCRVEGY